MDKLTAEQREEIRKRAEAASGGRWSWNINLRAKQVRLESDGPRQIVMDFTRWGFGWSKAAIQSQRNNGRRGDVCAGS